MKKNNFKFNYKLFYLLINFRTKGKKATYIDHPYLVGLTAFVKE